MPTKAPRAWGSDALTAYLAAYRANQFATFANKSDALLDIIRIDALFVRFLENAVNPRPFYPMSFMLRSHSAYRAGVGAVMAGQLYESQALFRLCLEHAAYGFYIGSNRDRMERWLRRGEDEQRRKAVRREFHIDKIRQHVRNHATLLCDHFDRLYHQLIEFGAHPNEQGYSLNSAISRTDDGDVHLTTIYLQGDGLPLNFSIRTAAQVGLWPLHLMQLLYRERYELLGIRADLDELRTRF